MPFPLGTYTMFYYCIGSGRAKKKVIAANSVDKLFDTANDDACANEYKYLDPIPGKGMKQRWHKIYIRASVKHVIARIARARMYDE